MKNILFITPRDARYGFSLAGAEQRLTTKSEIKQLLLELLETPAVALLVIDERLLQDLPAEELKDFEKKWPGALVILPAPVKPAEEEDYAMQLISKALGYHVRLNI